MARDSNGNGSPIGKTVAFLVGTLGLPAFLLLWTWGAFGSFMPAPVTAELRTHSDKMIHRLDAHESTAQESLRVWRHICRALYRDDPVGREGCRRTNGNGTP